MRSNEEKKNIRDVISKREVVHQKIQLWSNVYESDYALRLAVAADDDDTSEELFLAKTDPNGRYTHIVAESDYLEDFKEGWEYTLRHFIEQYKEALQQQPKEEYSRTNKPSTIHPSSSKSRFEQANTLQRKYYTIRLISYLKCHYCNLDFHDVKERRVHKLEWHV